MSLVFEMVSPPAISAFAEGEVVGIEVDSGERRSRVTLATAEGPVDFVVPGTNGYPSVVRGLPRFHRGERVRVELVVAPVGRTPRALGASIEHLDASPRFGLNGVHWAADRWPLRYELHETGIPGLSLEQAEGEVQAAFAQWNGVRCADFAFAYDGTTSEGIAIDGRNTLQWVSEDWSWSPEVAGLTMTQFDLSGDEPKPSESDTYFNAAHWTWTLEIGDVYAVPPLLNAGSVITHELGHVTGLDHEFQLVTSTMFYAYFGGDWGRTLSGDDRRGLCENYPNGSAECAVDADCDAIDGTPRVCTERQGVRVCDEPRDPVGAPCSRTSIACADRCVFTNASATEGYCSVACTADEDCPSGYGCGETENIYVPTDATLLCVPKPGGAPVDSDAPDSPPAEVGSASGCGCVSGSGTEFGGYGLVIAGLLGWQRRRRGIRSTP